MTNKVNGGGVSETEAVPPITVGNPAEAASFVIDQLHMEDYANPEAESSVVLCERPAKGQFFTVLPETGEPWQNRKFFYLLTLPNRDPYIVSPAIAKIKMGEEDVLRPVLLVRYVTMAGDEGLWPVKLDPPDGKSNTWNQSALNILKLVSEVSGGGWVRIVALKNHYRHQLSKKTWKTTPPKFSQRTYDELVSIRFKDRMIDSLEHPVWEELEHGSTK
jgi:hypothetical protein